MNEKTRNKRIGGMLRKARVKAGVSLEDAARFIGVTPASFSRMETNVSMVTAARMERLAEHYKISMAGLFDDQLLPMPSSIDFERVRLVVEAVQRVINSLRVKTSPEKMGAAVKELYRLEIERLANNPKAEFDPDHHIEIIQTMFKR